MTDLVPLEFAWVGSQEPCLDAVEVTTRGPVVIGRYGGRTAAGATKNEDGALVWVAPDASWEFAALIDAHYSAESAELLLNLLLGERGAIVQTLMDPPAQALPRLQQTLLRRLNTPEFKARCQGVTGEASCFFAARTGRYLWWLSIGDVVGYVLHPELAHLGSYQLNQRTFFEWVGERNTFEQDVPTYSQGTRHIFDGTTTILLTTDGLLEFGAQPFARPDALYHAVAGTSRNIPPLRAAVAGILERVHQDGGRDSATVLAWRIYNGQPVRDV